MPLKTLCARLLVWCFFSLLSIQLSTLAIFGQETSKCYRLAGLKNEDEIYLKINKTKVTGEYVIKRDYEDSTTDRYSFTGTAAGNTLTVKFNGEKPDSLPAKLNSYIWTITATPTREYLRVQFYGKNYNTNKYANYFSEFDSCEPVYGFLAKAPKIVQFAKGQNVVSMKVTFPDNKGYRTFLIGARKGQTLVITVLGCSMRVYLPDKTIYEYLANTGDADSDMAKTPHDLMTISPLPQSGNYLVALQIAGEDLSPRNVSFKITE